MMMAAATTMATPPSCSFLRCNRIASPPCGFSRSSGVRPPARYCSSCTCLRRSASVRAMVSEPTVGKQQQLKIVYDPDERINQLADEADRKAPLSRLTLFSPCKVILCGTGDT